ncbi:histidine kinase/DNA gyrase B/HSP90-like ATPase [Luteimonas cucumeris]|uniref:histidine kinase n=1 Tax=Luteimonas cucumeris TaxID=985012 RepID=A0A562LFF1_9GAMM|nr:ATP-binding protein [Luteimonas cucumeris]TWI06344.1 histidine kinase/DNA gyrase B/HSP90-like ATPase [Luteimonas cucumeris]
MQLLLLFYGTVVPVNWAWHLLTRPIAPGWTLVLVLDVIVAMLAFVSVALIRQGHFRIAIKLFVGASLASLMLAYHRLGTNALLIDQVMVILTLVISGLVLGRRALWTVFGILLLVFAIGYVADANNTERSEYWARNSWRNAPGLVLSYLLIAIILDRTLTALRESLADANARRRELQQEMAERERAQAQLIHAQKLEATGRLASGVAHDFNNILDVILGFSKQRHRIGEADDLRTQASELADTLEGVEIAARRGTAITRKLLSFSRSDLLRLEVFDAGQAIAELQPMLRQLFPPDVRVAYTAADMPLPVRLDRSEFELMILNIAANARDAMPDGGRFTVTTTRLADDAIEIAMADSGHGMDERVQRRIFEPFFTTKSAADGTGLGLAVIRDLITAGGGQIDVSSAVGAGATFRIHLPLATMQVLPEEHGKSAMAL